MSETKVIIYMPALNEGKTIKAVLKSVPKQLDMVTEIELLVINDGSSDNTESEALEAGASVISHNYNKGVGSAFHTAVDYTLKQGVEILVSVDADGQFDACQIQEMIAPIITNEVDFTIGNRFSNGRPNGMPKLKYWGNKGISKIVSFVSRTKIKDASCGFRAYSKDCLLNLNLDGSFTYTHETILDLANKGYRLAQIPVNVTYFDNRVSRVANSLTKYAFKTSSIIFKCLKDYKPLYFFGSIAMAILFVGLIFGGFVLIHWIQTGNITPYKSLGIIGLALVGMSLLLAVYALMADMLGRIRKNQEKILYYQKKQYFEKDN
ncbi:glycosyltransferase family 2 protein [Winogradskyella alexanderae]|uniref:Glycosyltransferase family 2 protein n=1 Tax=Winogradskyella alexanderae TaxID=2877123 RepID=A0ABS7XPS0_9FLAO|nr:glycosyltransferase family 2 protein [Winogradskyella alexanderae]MCA0132001.1 glycosyltransferase family 2 protein [Winogradskyella alexanderae]